MGSASTDSRKAAGKDIIRRTAITSTKLRALHLKCVSGSNIAAIYYKRTNKISRSPVAGYVRISIVYISIERSALGESLSIELITLSPQHSASVSGIKYSIGNSISHDYIVTSSCTALHLSENN
jgi:hypothetical protein